MRARRTAVTFLVLFLTYVTYGQEKNVSGKVTDEDGTPLPGVNIVVQETHSGTQTDFNGDYTLNVEVGQTLKFTYLGFQDHSETVGDSTTINVKLVEGSSALDEVVVTAFGRKTTRNETTSSVTTVDSSELAKSKTADPRSALQGKVPSLVMNSTSGSPGSEPEIRIRGINSITAGNSPLYVIDGVPVQSGDLYGFDDGTSMGIFSLINSADIESMSVLKDASAVAPYGADGANGVILINTKSGKRMEGKMHFELNTSIGIQNDARKAPSVFSGEERYNAILESVWNSFGNDPWGSNAIQSHDEASIRNYIDNNLSGSKGSLADKIDRWESHGRPNVDWQNIVRNRNALLTNVNFSAAKSDGDSNFYASLGYNKTEGTIIGADLQRVSGSLNYGTKFGDRFDFDISTHVANAEQHYLLEEAVYFTNPLSSRYDLSPWLSPYHEDGSLNIDDFVPYSGAMYNIVQTTENNDFTRDVTRALANAKLDVDITDDLTLRTVFGLDYTQNSYKKYDNPLHGDGADAFGRDEEAIQRLYNFTSQNSLDYNFSINHSHNFRITTLQEYTKYKDKYLDANMQGFPNERLKNLSSASQIRELPTSTYTDQAKMRYVGLLNYDFNHKYVLDASYSYQGDSRFSDKWDDFYSIGAAWNMDKEDFIKDISFLDQLRLKAGYGLTGNANIDRNQYQQLIKYTSYNDNTASILDTYGTDASWEKSKRIDVGTEFSMLSNRLSGSIGYYHNKTTDMLLQIPLPESSGFPGGVVLRNAGEMTNQGLEITLSGDIIETPDFTWNLSGNISTLSNKVTEIPEAAEVKSSNSVIEKGHRVNEWYMPVWAGVDPDNGLPLYYKNKTGDETTRDYSEAERRYIGENPIPTYNGSVSTRLTYKNIFLEGTLYFSGGNKIYEDRPDRLYTTSGSLIQARNPLETVYKGAWREPGDQSHFPRFDYNNSKISSAGDRNNYSTLYLHDGDFMRLKDVGIGYTFDQDFIKDIGLNQVDFSIRGKNLWTWVKDSDLKFDPEVRTDGIARFYNSPPIKSIVFNLNVKF